MDLNNSSISSVIVLLVFTFVFYFLIWRPQNQKSKEKKFILDNIEKGNEIITIGGIFGKIVKIDDDIVTILVNKNSEIKIKKNCINSIIPKNSLDI